MLIMTETYSYLICIGFLCHIRKSKFSNEVGTMERLEEPELLGVWS